MEPEITQDDIDRARRTVKQEYREETGHELPDHVLDNLEYLGTAGLRDRAEIDAMIEEAREAEEPDAKEIMVFMGWLGLTMLAAVYLSRFLAGTGAQVVGGVAIWLALFGASGLAIDAVSDRWPSKKTNQSETDQ